MTNPSPKVAVIILNWNGFTDSCECIESVLKSDYSNYHIFLVDNGSEDGSGPKLKAKFPQVTYIQNEENLGFTGGNNVAIKLAMERGYDYFWLLNNDTLIEPNCISVLIKEGEKDNSVGLLSPLIYNYPDKNRLQNAGCYIHWDTFSTKSINSVKEYLNIKKDHPVLLWGTALIIKRCVINSIGLLDDKFFAYHEDLDYCMRAINRGYACQLAPDTKVFHKNSYDLQEMKNLEDYYFYYMTRNTFWLLSKNKKGLNKLFIKQKYFASSIQMIGNYRNLKFSNAIDASLNGLYHAFLNIGGRWDRNLKCPKSLEKTILSHPFFFADLINLKFNNIFSTLYERLKITYSNRKNLNAKRIS